MAVILIVGLADGARTTFAGLYLQSYDPDAGPNGAIKVTRHRERALDLPRSELIALWRQQSTTHPLRLDGKPNRPLTAYTIEVGP